ncbi:FAD-dependent tricarballylate dehydrogenase TcuA [Salirhabdus salicampi]|uniref:FAD-dependent tricarballylate dehydrogenase TcuA n=1 Tax=Salirhabdus salicampi TaxID=476102 RepID=UPI0020C2FD25|nr:FAD-dependent tricarballylate dehydrogenase TcuA [Salirhabdus salicampi]MCP8616323.1 FAD-dependent tricarballylate dehydrogenase TcuA [Salirhabdus salicampi]
MKTFENETQYDVVVVGAGNAALTAAISAKQRGANVLVLEKSTEELRGGNTRFTGGIFRCTYNSMDELAEIVGEDNDVSDQVTATPYSEEDFTNDIQRTAGGRADSELTKALVSRSYQTVLWMSKLGVPWEYNQGVGTVKTEGKKTVLPFGAAVRVVHEGVGLSQKLFEIANKEGIEILYEAEAKKLLVSEDNSVKGVQIRTKEGIKEISSNAVILASGGFQASPEMRTAYLGPDWSLVKVRGTRFNTGEMIRSAFEIGAQPYGEFSGKHATPISADAPDYGDLALTDRTNRLSYHFGIMLNLDGKRFVDEGEDKNTHTYAKFGEKILQQKNAIAFQLFDRKSFELLEPRYSTSTPIEGDTIAEVGTQLEEKYKFMGFNKEEFLKTVEEYNHAVQGGEFNPDILDKKHTSGLQINKTNWARKINEGPFRVYPVTGGITFTFGGVRINTDAEVLDSLDRPIPGLYSTGEMTGGFFYQNYPMGSGLTRGAVFGKTAGEKAAIHAASKSVHS